MKDVLTGLNHQYYLQNDFSNDWKKAVNLGTARSGKKFKVNAYLGGTNLKDVYDSADRLKFGVHKSIHLEINTDPQVITELVKFEKGQAVVVGSIEYGDRLSLNLPPGYYGLSFFVEGDLINYHVNAQFSSLL